VVDVEARSVVVDEDPRFGLGLSPEAVAPDLERFEHVGPHIPRAGAVGLVLVEVEAIVDKVDVRPSEP
jgi:hypothetical protein